MAISLDELEGKFVTFQLYPAAIITDNFTNVKIVGTTTFEGAQAYISPQRLHSMVFPTLPSGTPNDHRLYRYALVMRHDSTITAVGMPWIKEGSVVVHGAMELNVTIRGKTAADVALLRQVLMENNFTDFEISTTGV